MNNAQQNPTENRPFEPSMLRSLDEQIQYLAERNSDIKSLNYFYEVYKEIYGNRAKELAKHKKDGKKIIGVFCNFVPLELILAADAIPIRLASGFQDPILLAEEILPRNFCPLIKSSYGISLMNSPHFDLIDLIIIPTTCDGKKKLGEILSERKPTWIIEVPHTNETPQARQLWLTEIELLKKQLENITGNKITAKKLQGAIELVNRKRAATRRLYDLRKRTPPPIWGRDAMLVTNLSLYDDIGRWTKQTEALCNELYNHKPVCDNTLPRIMITGSPTVFPTWKIPVLLEESGGIIVMDDICTGSKELWDPIETASWTMKDMLIAIADKYLMNTCACFTPNMVRVDRIVQFAKEYEINGALYHVLQACHIYGMEELRIEKALDKMNIPILIIETDFSQEDVEQIRTRVEAFLEMVALRKSTGQTEQMPTKPAEGLVRQLQTPTAQTTSQKPAPVASATSAAQPVANDPTSRPEPLVTDPTAKIADPTPVASTTPAASPNTPPIANDPTAAPVVKDPTQKKPPQLNDPTVAIKPNQNKKEDKEV